jgi:choline dehydrogenase-like flavoprotein
MLGQLRGLPGLHVADGSVLPRLSACHPTFTITANADRMARTVRDSL